MQYRNGQRLPPDAVGVPARLSVNPRARRLSIRIDGRAGEAVLVAPSERGLAGAAVDADRQPPGARIDRQPQRQPAVKRQPLPVPVAH